MMQETSEMTETAKTTIQNIFHILLRVNEMWMNPWAEVHRLNPENWFQITKLKLKQNNMDGTQSKTVKPG